MTRFCLTAWAPAIADVGPGLWGHPGSSSREHGQGLPQGADARVHLQRRVETISVGRGVAAPATLADDHGVEVHAEGLADTGLDAAIGRAAADHQRGAVEYSQQLGHPGAVECAGAALEVHVVLGLRGNVLREAGLRR